MHSARASLLCTANGHSILESSVHAALIIDNNKAVRPCCCNVCNDFFLCIVLTSSERLHEWRKALFAVADPIGMHCCTTGLISQITIHVPFSYPIVVTNWQLFGVDTISSLHFLIFSPQNRNCVGVMVMPDGMAFH